MLSRFSRTKLSAPLQARTIVSSAIRTQDDAPRAYRPRSDNASRSDRPRSDRPQSDRSDRPRYPSSQGQGNRTGGDRDFNQARAEREARDFNARLEAAQRRRTTPPSLLTLADLSSQEIIALLRSSLVAKLLAKQLGPNAIKKSLSGRTVALMFSKRSTRTRVASETAVETLGGHPMFLGSQDVQLGVNESLRDTATVVGSMVDGIMARVGAHSEVETLAQHSVVPVINALSDLYHPTQILADLLTIFETYAPDIASGDVTAMPNWKQRQPQNSVQDHVRSIDMASIFKGKKVAWIGDTNNIVNELMVTLPRLGMTMGVASPKGYDKVDERVWKRIVDAGTEASITLTNSPAEALKDADIVVTDTWISMGQETEKAARISAFEGYQITNSLVSSSGAKPDWKFMHCLPRKQEEVDDDVFYGERSLVFPEAENRKWTTIACFDAMIGQWRSC